MLGTGHHDVNQAMVSTSPDIVRPRSRRLAITAFNHLGAHLDTGYEGLEGNPAPQPPYS
jgi:hypothetical protein